MDSDRRMVWLDSEHSRRCHSWGAITGTTMSADTDDDTRRQCSLRHRRRFFCGVICEVNSIDSWMLSALHNVAATTVADICCQATLCHTIYVTHHRLSCLSRRRAPVILSHVARPSPPGDKPIVWRHCPLMHFFSSTTCNLAVTVLPSGDSGSHQPWVCASRKCSRKVYESGRQYP